MGVKEFEQLFERRVKMSRHTLIQKAKEYATEEDRLHNFKVGSARLNCLPSQYALSLVTKQIECIYDVLLSGEQITQALIDEKFGDCINYLMLIEGCLKDEKRVK
ncbi:MAG: hypothetical protein PHO27_12000 [Sulfuricurvum sp.]|jgi:hypothetical protein|nr:hypothetical protein [Sulfuricurvum sp.]